MSDTVLRDEMRVEFKCGCTTASLYNGPGPGESEVGKAIVGGGNTVMPCSEYNKPESPPVGLFPNPP